MAWWVVPEGVLGDLVNDLAEGSLTGIRFTVTEAAAKPNGGVGPYPSQAAAQAEANSLSGQVNAAGNAALPGVVKPESVSILGLPHWGSAELRNFALRGLKIIIGIGLVLLGVVQLTHATRLVDAAASVAEVAA